MNASLGFMTAFGGMTSHAALVARQMGKVCIVGCDALSFDYHARTMTVTTAKGEVVVKEGDWISIDGFAGEVIQGRVDTTPVGGHPGAHREEPRRQGGAHLPDATPS